MEIDRRCYARKAKKPFERCNFKNQILENGCIFCKIHQKSKNTIRYDEEVLNKKINDTKLISLAEYPISIKKSRKKDLIHTLGHYNISTKGKKEYLVIEINKLFSKLINYDKNIGKIQKIQRWIKKNKMKIDELVRGPIVRDVYCSSNNQDFLTFENICDIDKEYLFSYQDSENFVYAFDIRSISSLIRHDDKNPYNRKKIPEEILEKIKYCSNKINIQKEFIDLRSPYQKLKHRVIDIFQKMDNLDQYTDPAWFLELNLIELQKFYRELEDIWNWRLNLSNAVKKDIIPHTKIFDKNSKISPSPNILSKISNKIKVQIICLDTIELLISSAKKRCDKINGCVYVLFAFVMVSKKAAKSLPIYFSMVGNTLEVNNVEYIPI